MKLILGAIKEFDDDALMLARQLGSVLHGHGEPVSMNLIAAEHL